MFTVLLVVQILVTMALVGFILLQRSDQDGFGLGSGGGGGGLMTGRGKANFMTRTTAILATVFMANSLFMAILVSRSSDDTSLADAVAEGSMMPSVEESIELEQNTEKQESATPEDAPADAAPAPVAPADTVKEEPSVPLPE